MDTFTAVQTVSEAIGRQTDFLPLAMALVFPPMLVGMVMAGVAFMPHLDKRSRIRMGVFGAACLGAAVLGGEYQHRHMAEIRADAASACATIAESPVSQGAVKIDAKDWQSICGAQDG